MQRLAETCERIAATTKKTEKTAIVADYLRSRELGDAAISAVFLSGRSFPAFDERTLQIGGALLWKLVLELAGGREAALSAAYRKRGDLGSAAADVLAATAPSSSTITLAQVRETFDRIAETRTATAKSAALKALLERAHGSRSQVHPEDHHRRAAHRAQREPGGGGDRQGLRRAARPRAARQHAVGRYWRHAALAAEHRLDQARMRLFHPIGFMLASPAADSEEAFQYFEHALVEDKYDGIRAQAHCGAGQVRLFSRTLDEVTPSFPELVGGLSEFAGEVILDGEIVAWRDNPDGGHAMPFSEIQKRLGRKQVSQRMIAEVPVAYVVFDVIYAGGELTLDKPLAERGLILDRVFAGANRVSPRPVVNAQGSLLFEPEIEEAGAESGWIIRAPAMRADSPQQLEELFEQAMARGNEGLMIKDLESPYMPGRRGRWWLKLKRELATLDVVVTAAEFGHGKRIHVLSDYTFAVRKGEELVNIGKAYSGLTDKEIAELTQWFLAHTIADHGHVREVEPKIVLEVAFNAIMRSGRHDSGFALRFPRIVRVREDKLTGRDRHHRRGGEDLLEPAWRDSLILM